MWIVILSLTFMTLFLDPLVILTFSKFTPTFTVCPVSGHVKVGSAISETDFARIWQNKYSMSCKGVWSALSILSTQFSTIVEIAFKVEKFLLSACAKSSIFCSFIKYGRKNVFSFVDGIVTGYLGWHSFILSKMLIV